MFIGQKTQSQSACPSCNTTDATVIALVDGKTRQALTTLECANCGLGRIDPLPTLEELDNWYKTSYRQDYKNAFKPALRHVLRAGRNAMSRQRLLKQHTAQHPIWHTATQQNSRTLDIGASSGEFVFLMQHLGFNASGIEPHQGYCEHAKQHLGLNIHHGSLQQQLALLGSAQFSLISMFHVFEHLVDPLSTLRALKEKLTEDGLIFVEVPNATRPTSPHYMFFKAHTLYFTASTLMQMFRSAGFNVLHISAASEDNLSIIAKRSDEAVAQAPHHSSAGALLAAQSKRRWLPYLWHQLSQGRIGEKLKKHKEEKNTSENHTSAKDLLQSLYAGAS